MHLYSVVLVKNDSQDPNKHVLEQSTAFHIIFKSLNLIKTKKSR